LASDEYKESVAVQASQRHDVMYDSDIDWVKEEVVCVVPVSFADMCYENSDTDSECEGEEAPASKRRQLQDIMFANIIDCTVEDVEVMSGVEVIIIAQSAILG